MAELKKFYNIEQVCQMFNTNNKLYVYDLIKKGELEAFKFGNKYLITEEAIQKYVESHQVEPKAEK